MKKFLLFFAACAVLPLFMGLLVTRAPLQVAPQAPVVFHALPQAQARDIPKTVIPERRVATPDAPSVTATSAVVVDRATGAVLFAKDAERPMPIASVTKLMTAMVFLDAEPAWGRVITIEPRDLRIGSVPVFVAGDRVAVNDLFWSALVGSINTAAAALARATDLSDEEFVALMNVRAEMFGLSHTAFVEPTGLDAGNRSTALDLVRLARIAFTDTAIASALTVPDYRVDRNPPASPRWIATTNDLLRHPPTDYRIVAAKTGFTGEAGYTFVAEGARDGHGVLVAILDAESDASRFSDADALIRWALDAHQW
jgi:D-alanyl-D-alanine carboxypeptidase